MTILNWEQRRRKLVTEASQEQVQQMTRIKDSITQISIAQLRVLLTIKNREELYPLS